jgi:hypothetical protein
VAPLGKGRDILESAAAAFSAHAVKPPRQPTAINPPFSTPQMPIRLLFIVLVPCLFLQLKLRTDTEPYPAILLPSGASLLRSEGSYTGFETKSIAEDSRGRRYPLAVEKILNTVPTNYRPYVVDAGFGINKERIVRHLPIPFAGRGLQLGRPKTPAQLEATRAWLRLKLYQTLGIDAVRIHVLTYAVTTYYSEVPLRQQRRLQRETSVELIGATK